MLQIILTLTIFFVSTSVSAQNYQDGQNVPAFLRDEATKNQYGNYQIQYQQYQENSQNQQGNKEPAFLKMEKQQQIQYQQQLQQIQTKQSQYQYQSADPSSGSFTLPPATYQAAPGDKPYFLIQQDENKNIQTQNINVPTVKTNKKEDVIQINFSDDQYKSEEEVTPLNKEQATQYNSEVDQNTESEAVSSELKEGEKFETDTNQLQKTEVVNSEPDTNQKAKQEEQNEIKTVVPEPNKSHDNILRISYNKDDIDLKDDDKKAIINAANLLKQNKSLKILLKSFVSSRGSKSDANKIGLLRVINIRDYLMRQGVDFSRTEVKIIEPELNKEELDYIDIDKI